jgi:tetratricopeptide (TPR) repeat protein
MSNVAKLKKQAAEFEQNKQFDKALAVYVKLLDSFDQNANELDVALFNRVGDILLRQGNVADAVDYYERAVDRYAETGFFNNALALCNKILRHSPGRAIVYYKLGKISAHKGLKNDAKVNFLEYADRMQKAGKVDEAFRALKEFADLCPDQDEIRLMLADQLTKAARKPEAIEQLQTLYERYDAEGRAADAAATADRMRAIDPTVEPRAAATNVKKRTSAELIFLDLDAPSPLRGSSKLPMYRPPATPPRNQVGPAAPATPAAPVKQVEKFEELGRVESVQPVEQDVHLELTQGGTDSEIKQIIVHGPELDVSRVGDDTIGLEHTPPEPLLGLELTRLEDDGGTPRRSPGGSLLGLELTALDSDDAAYASGATAAQEESAQEEYAAGDDLDFITPPEPSEPTPPEPPPREPSPHAGNPALAGLPMMDLESAPPRRPPARMVVEDPLNLDFGAEGLTKDDDAIEAGTPLLSRHSMMVAQESVDSLRTRVDADPTNWDLRRGLAEAMLEAGDRAGGIKELETAMTGAERAGNLELASALAEEIARLEPEAVRHQQKRVEYAFRTNDRARLIDAYLALADVLLRSDQSDKARSIYQRVLDLAPNEPRAHVALETIAVVMQPEPEPPPMAPTPGISQLGVGTPHKPQAGIGTPARAGLVNLGDWLRDDAHPKDTRMVVAEQEPTGDEEADFADMLRKFKQGLAENLDAEDYQSHYDLAIAFREMGLIDEAIAEFQKALGSPTNRLATYEALGQCFMDKGQFKLASSVLSRALNEKAPEDQLVGVLYLLGSAAEAQGNTAEALGYYQRVFVVDIQFRDIAARMRHVERVAR